MSAIIISPEGGDTVVIPSAPMNQLIVNVWYNEGVRTNVKACVMGVGCGPEEAEIGCGNQISKISVTDGTYTLKAFENGAVSNTQNNVTVHLFAGPGPGPGPFPEPSPPPIGLAGGAQPATVTPPTVTALRPGVFLVSGSVAGANPPAYVVVTAYELSTTGTKTPVDGVMSIPDAAGSYSVEVEVGRDATKQYVARVIFLDTTDSILQKTTVVLA